MSVIRKTKPKITELLLIVAVFLACLLLAEPSALAAERNADLDIITSVNITDSNGNALTNNTAKDASIILEYTFAIPTGTTGAANDTFTISVPDEIAIFSDLTANIAMSDSTPVATAFLNASSRTITLTFTENAFTYSNVSGNFWFELGFNSSEIGDTNPVDILFDTGAVSSDITVSVNFDQTPDPTATVQKSGTYDASANEITWTITANPENVAVGSLEISDTLTSEQTFVNGSLEVNGSAAGASDYSYDSGSGTLTYTAPGAITTQQTITFRTSVSDSALLSSSDASLTVTNSADMTADGDTTTSNTASVNIPIDLISKSGNYTAYNGSVTWSVVVNANNLTIDNATVTDTLPIGLDLDTATVAVDGATISAGTGAGTFDVSGQVLTVDLGNITSSHTITYTCAINDQAFLTQENEAFVNSAVLNGDSVTSNNTASSTFTPSTPIIAKSALGYDPSTGYIEWQVYVNGHGGMDLTVTLENVVLTETITDPDQKYVTGSLIVKDKGGNVYTGGTLTSESASGFVYEFPATITDTYIATFYTKLTDPEQYKSNYTGTAYNSIDVDLDNGTGGSSSFYQAIDSEVFSKSAGSYDYSTREMTWTIVVDDDQVPLDNVVVTDSISSGQTFLASSFTVTDSLGTAYTSGTLNSDATSFTYSFGGTISDTYTITYKTELTDLTLLETNGSFTLSNDATLTHDEIASPLTDSASKTITSELVTKDSDYTSGNDYIDWTIIVNRNQLSLVNAVITDTLETGLSLDTSSIELYSLTVNSDNSVTKNTQISISGSNVSYNYSTGLLTVTLPSPTSSAYSLTFRTYVTVKTNSPFGNTATFDADSIAAVGYSIPSEVAVSFVGSGGSATGTLGSMTVYKVDASDNNVLLENAVFNLVDRYGIVIDQQTTDANGEAFFDRLQLDTEYTLYEITAPDGYSIGTLGTTGYTFTIASSDTTGFNKTVTFENATTASTGSITLTKQDDGGNALENAEFTLYASSDTSHATPLATATSDASGIVLFENVALGSYDILETTAPTGYALSSTVATATISTGGVTVFASPSVIVDTYCTGNLTIKKTVSGDLASTTRAFTFTVTFGSNGSYPYTGSYSGTISSGDTIQLSHGQSITIMDLPAGMSYSVTESNYGSYQRTSTSASGVIAADTTRTASFVNTLSSVPKTGDDDTWMKGAIILALGVVGFAVFAVVRHRGRGAAKRSAKHGK